MQYLSKGMQAFNTFLSKSVLTVYVNYYYYYVLLHIMLESNVTQLAALFNLISWEAIGCLCTCDSHDHIYVLKGLYISHIILCPLFYSRQFLLAWELLLGWWATITSCFKNWKELSGLNYMYKGHFNI